MQHKAKAITTLGQEGVERVRQVPFTQEASCVPTFVSRSGLGCRLGFGRDAEQTITREQYMAST